MHRKNYWLSGLSRRRQISPSVPWKRLFKSDRDFHRAAATLGLWLLLGITGTGYSQEVSPAPTPTPLPNAASQTVAQPVIVSATRIDIPLSESPATVSVVT